MSALTTSDAPAPVFDAATFAIPVTTGSPASVFSPGVPPPPEYVSHAHTHTLHTHLSARLLCRFIVCCLVLCLARCSQCCLCTNTLAWTLHHFAGAREMLHIQAPFAPKRLAASLTLSFACFACRYLPHGYGLNPSAPGGRESHDFASQARPTAPSPWSQVCHHSLSIMQDITSTAGYLRFHPMAQCVVQGLACRVRVTPASSPASHCK